MHDKRCSLKEAVQMIRDGSMITFSGFTIWRRPMAAIYEMMRQGKRNLHLIEVNSGTHTEMLIGAGAVSIWESCWIGHELYGKVPYCIDRKIKSGEIIAEDYSHQHILYRMQAGAAGVPYLPTWASRGTDILNPEYDMLGKAGLRDGKNPHIPLQKYAYAQDPFYNEGEMIHVPAARPDVCIIHVQQVGEEGTVRVMGQTFSDEQAAKAADKVIVMAEEIVPESFLRDEPERNLLDRVKNSIHDAPERAKASMNNFLYTVGISYLPLHEKAVETAKAAGTVEVKRDKKKSSFLNAYESIQKELDRGRLGFKRKYVRC